MYTKRFLIGASVWVLGLLISGCATPAAVPTAPPKAVSPSTPAVASTAVPSSPATAAPTSVPSAAPTKAAAKEERAAIRLGYLNTYFDAPTVIGMRERLFEQEGLAMTYFPFSVGRDALQALVGGALDVAPMAATPFISASSSGPIVSIGIVEYNPGTNAVVVGKDSPIKQGADLKGKRIATPFGTVADYIFQERYLPSVGLKPADIQLVNMQIPNMLSALTVGSVDGFVANDPYPILAEEAGAGRVLKNFAEFDSVPGIYAAQRSFVEANPTTMVKFMKGHMRASRLIKDDFSKASIMMREFMVSLKIQLAQESADKLMKNVDATPFYEPRFVQYLDEQAQREKSLGNIKSIPDWSRVILAEFQDRAAAELGIKNPFK